MVVSPRIVVRVNGLPLDGEAARALGEVSVQQRLSLPTLCELIFRDPAGALAEAGGLAVGDALAIEVEGCATALFGGEATAVEYRFGPDGGREVRVRAYDRLHRLRKRQAVAAHVQVSLAELVRTLVSDLGLMVEAGADGPVQQQLLQYRQSDLALIQDVAARAGLYFTLRDEVLYILTLDGIGDVVPLALGASLLEASIEVNSDAACRSVETRGWDPWHGEAHRGAARTPRVGRRVGIGAAPDRVGGSGERTLTDWTLQGDDAAEGRAQAELDRRAAGEVTLWGLANGDPRLRPGTSVELSGVADRLAGRYVLTAVTHRLDRRQGFLSEFETAAPPAPAPVAGNGLTLGRVSQIEDPEGLGRVRVVLPACGDLETGWLAVVIPGAGRDKGLIALPDIDDRVLVLFPPGEPAQGLVLGGLYGSEMPPDSGVDAGAVQRYTWVTRGGQRVQLDDGGDRVRIENSGGDFVQLAPDEVRIGDRHGSLIELTPDVCRLHAQTRLEIEAPGQPIVIRGQAIDFERG